MVAILAGCDGVGKSTCFNLLRKSQISANFIKESYTNDVEEKRLRVMFTASKARDSSLTIYDRATVLDDIVYDPIVVNQQSLLLSMWNKRILSDILNSCLIIYFDLDNLELRNRLENRGDEYVGVRQINEIKDGYSKTFADLNVDFVRLDVTGLSEVEVYEKVRRIIEDYEKLKNC